MKSAVRRILLAWLLLAIPPAAWLAAFAIYLGLVNHGCPRFPVAPMITTGFAGSLLSFVTGVCAYRMRAAPDRHSDESGRDTLPFLLHLALGLACMFALLIAVTTAPVEWLGACPT